MYLPGRLGPAFEHLGSCTAHDPFLIVHPHLIQRLERPILQHPSQAEDGRSPGHDLVMLRGFAQHSKPLVGVHRQCLGGRQAQFLIATQ